MDNLVLRTIIYATAAFFTSLILTRIMGRKAISQMTFFDFVVGITFGSLTANMAMGPANKLVTAATALIVISFIAITMGYLRIKSFHMRKASNAEPVTIIENGKINEQNMSKIRYTIDDLMMHLREKNAFNIADVEFAILETDGKLSVLPKSQKQPLTPSDINISTGYKGLTKDFIMDGNVMRENLTDVRLNEEWLLRKLSDMGVTSPEEVFYAGLDTSGNLFISKKKERHESHGKYGIE